MEEPVPGGEDRPRRRWTSLAVLGACVLAVAVLWVVGGFDAAPHGPKTVPVGSKVDQRRFTVTFVSARIGQAKGQFGTDTRRSLIVRLKVTNNSRKTTSLSSDLAQGIAGEPKPGSYLAPDNVIGYANGSETTAVQPGLPVEAELIWPLSPQNTPAKITVALWRWDYSTGFTDPQYNWKVDKKFTKPAAKITLAVSPS
ncbi:hypothetical protein ACRYCC_08800 [Actinomadura scrupuli]|uniref:hypothetical protein n=1 Tax=Actinomadura scrupuli TaxID=559629 RepID=UPI003D986FBF